MITAKEKLEFYSITELYELIEWCDYQLQKLVDAGYSLESGAHYKALAHDARNIIDEKLKIQALKQFKKEN